MGPGDQRNLPQTREVRDEGSKDVLGPDGPTAPHWTPAPTLRQSEGSSYSTLVNKRLFHARHHCLAGGDVKPRLHTGHSVPSPAETDA